MTSVLDRPQGRHAGAAPRRRLVVVGNGMAGARAVEEILARGGAEQFSITMFGDEPYGNYNRIMLSHVLSGEESDADIFLNSLPWYEENGIILHAGVRVEKIDPYAKRKSGGCRFSSVTTAPQSGTSNHLIPNSLSTGASNPHPSGWGVPYFDGSCPQFQCRED